MKSPYSLVKDLSLCGYTQEYYGVVRQYLKNELEILKKEGKALHEMKILNLGAGDCFSSSVLKESVQMVVSFDISRKQLMSGHWAGCDQNPVLGSWDNLPFKRGCFDMVFADRCLHHSDDLTKTLSEVSPVLKEDGVILATREPMTPYIFSNKIKRRFGSEDKK